MSECIESRAFSKKCVRRELWPVIDGTEIVRCSQEFPRDKKRLCRYLEDPISATPPNEEEMDYEVDDESEGVSESPRTPSEHTDICSLRKKSIICEVQSEDYAENESVFSDISPDVLHMIMTYLPKKAQTNVKLVCKRWNDIGRVAFNEFKDARYFMHAVYVDQSKLYSMVNNQMFLELLKRDRGLLGIICQRVQIPDILEAVIECEDRQHWHDCIYKAAHAQNGNALKILKLRSRGWKLHSKEIFKILNNALVRYTRGTPGILELFLTLFEQECEYFLSHPDVSEFCCSRQEVLDSISLVYLLLRFRAFASFHNIQRAMNHAFDKGDQLLAETVMEAAKKWCTFSLRRYQWVIQILHKACEKGWALIISRLLDFPVLKFLLTPEHLEVALERAVCSKDARSVELLLRVDGADPGARNNALIRQSMEIGSVEITLLLMRSGRVDMWSDKDPRTNLFCHAIATNHGRDLLDRMYALTEFDCSVLGKDAMEIACRRQNLEAIEFLLELPDFCMDKGQFGMLLGFVGALPGSQDTIDRIIRNSRFDDVFSWE